MGNQVKYPDYSRRRQRPKRRRLPIIRALLFLAFILGMYQLLKPSGDSLLPLKGKEGGTINVVLSEDPPETSVNPVLAEPEPSPPPSSTSTQNDFEKKDFLARQGDPRLGQSILDVLKSQNPYGGFYLVVDGETGRILAWAEQDGNRLTSEPSFLSDSDFPAASLSKIITAAAALESGRYSLATEIPSIGSTVTLYRRQLKFSPNYKGNMVSLKRAFASSMNPPMGIVGQNLGGNTLKRTAERLGFNLNFPNDIPHRSTYDLPKPGFGVAEAASGYTTEITLSPLLAGSIVRSVLTGKSPELLWSPEIGDEYAPSAPGRLSISPLSDETYESLQQMFEATVLVGSARRTFRDKSLISSRNRRKLRVGGKTGTKNMEGLQYQWFAGFAEDRNNPRKSVVVICLHMNELKGTRANYPAKAAAMLMHQWALQNVQ